MELLHADQPNAHGPSPLPSRSGADTGLDIKAILGRALRQWYLFILFPLLTGALAWAYLRYEVPEYAVKAVILIKESAEDRALAEVVSGAGGALVSDKATNLTNQIEILGSYAIMREVVDSLELAVNYISAGRLKDAYLYKTAERPFLLTAYDDKNGELYGRELNIVLQEDGRTYSLQEGEAAALTGYLGTPLELPFGTITLASNPTWRTGRKDAKLVIRNPIQVARNYSNRLSIRTVRGSELLEMSLEDPVPARAIDVINTVIDRYNATTIAEKNEVASKTTNFVNDRLDYLTRELNEVEVAAENYVINNDIVGGTERELETSFERLRANEGEIIQLKLKEDALDQVERGLSVNVGDSLSYLPYSVNLENLNLSPLIAQYNQLLQEREQLLLSARPDNPVLIPVQEQITEVKRVIQKALAEARIKLANQEREFERDSERVWREIRQIPGKQRGLLAIERQQNIREQLYLFLLQKREETALSSAAAVSNIRILEEPMQRGTTSMGGLQVYGIALLMGLLLPFGLVTLQEVLDDTVKSPEQLKQLTNAPLLGTIAQESADKRIVVSRSSRTAIAEMFRMLRTNLQFLGAGREQQVMLVTSSMGGEGKTFVCINLGMSLAISGKKVILLGMDLRKPKLAKYLTNDEDYRGSGITNYLTGNANLSEIIHTTAEHENLDFISSGVIPPNPAELLLLPQLETLLQQLREQYDYVLIDLPPVGLVTDALLLSRHVDAALYVTRFGKTKRGQIGIIDEIYQTGKLPNVALVLNGVRTGRGYGYGYGYGYYEGKK